ncbi:MAG TPA: hypothetical protein VK797_21860, partial [Tepidisphaeraceae bacterium]|nr:hypothetical protein [Tepidisphaeraceae bacterium]
ASVAFLTELSSNVPIMNGTDVAGEGQAYDTPVDAGVQNCPVESLARKDKTYRAIAWKIRGCKSN